MAREIFTKADRAQIDAMVARQIRAQRHKNDPQGEVAKRSRRLKFPSPLPIDGWNKRKMTSADFREICARERIIVLRVPLPYINGLCVDIDETPTIWIDSRLKGINRVRTEFHELAHYFFHDGSELLSLPEPEEQRTRRRFELEANNVALDAIAPRVREFARKIEKEWPDLIGAESEAE